MAALLEFFKKIMTIFTTLIALFNNPYSAEITLTRNSRMYDTVAEQNFVLAKDHEATITINVNQSGVYYFYLENMDGHKASTVEYDFYYKGDWGFKHSMIKDKYFLDYTNYNSAKTDFAIRLEQGTTYYWVIRNKDKNTAMSYKYGYEYYGNSNSTSNGVSARYVFKKRTYGNDVTFRSLIWINMLKNDPESNDEPWISAYINEHDVDSFTGALSILYDYYNLTDNAVDQLIRDAGYDPDTVASHIGDTWSFLEVVLGFAGAIVTVAAPEATVAAAVLTGVGHAMSTLDIGSAVYNMCQNFVPKADFATVSKNYIEAVKAETKRLYGKEYHPISDNDFFVSKNRCLSLSIYKDGRVSVSVYGASWNEGNTIVWHSGSAGVAYDLASLVRG